MAALALALGGGALGVGCGEDDNGPAKKGEGGSGGTGGTGGTGGQGGDVPCGLDWCLEGETCDLSSGTPKCQCDPDADACELGKYCDPSELRCRDLPAPPRERGECAREGEVKDGLFCASFGTVNFWLRQCNTRDDCPMKDSFCGAEFGGTGLCIPNLCGKDDGYVAQGFPANGDIFDTCSPTGRDGNPPTGLVGSCIPNTNFHTREAGVCHVNGTSTTTCRMRAPGDFDPANACAEGMACDYIDFVTRIAGSSCTEDSDCPNPAFGCDEFGTCTLKKCTQDTDCGTGNYCGFDGFCADIGDCVAVCNAGTSGESAGEFAGCIEDGKICTRHPQAQQSSGSALVYGQCGDPECSEDNPCNKGFECVEGRCVREGSCADDEACPGEQICEDNACVDPFCTEANAGETCEANEVCVDGRCVEDEGCADDDACPGEQICEDSACVDPFCTEATVEADCGPDKVCENGRCADADEGDDA